MGGIVSTAATSDEASTAVLEEKPVIIECKINDSPIKNNNYILSKKYDKTSQTMKDSLVLNLAFMLDFEYTMFTIFTRI